MLEAVHHFCHSLVSISLGAGWGRYKERLNQSHNSRLGHANLLRAYKRDESRNDASQLIQNASLSTYRIRVNARIRSLDRRILSTPINVVRSIDFPYLRGTNMLARSYCQNWFQLHHPVIHPRSDLGHCVFVGQCRNTRLSHCEDMYAWFFLGISVVSCS